MKIPRIAYAAFGFALIVIVLDQSTKAWVMGGLDLREMFHIQVWPPLFNLTWVENRGVSFGLFGDGSGRWALSAFSIAVAGVLGWWALKADRRLLITAIGLIMGGALGNVIDRIRFGFVVDFLDFHLRIHHFPAFNVADSAICVGVGIYVLGSLLVQSPAPAGEKSPEMPAP